MSNWLAQYFVNSSYIMTGGAALVAVPVIIHLINRMRFRRVRFAAMEFLLQSQQENRRQILLEQLLLLLLRVLLVIGLIALISRFILDSTQMSMFRGTQLHHVILIDDSVSMRDRWGEQQAFQEGLKIVRKLVNEGAQRPGTQKLTLLKVSDPQQPIFTQRDLSQSFLNEFEAKIENLRCSYQAVTVVEGLQSIGKLLEQERGSIRFVHLISDFRNSDWGEESATSKAVQSLAETGITINLIRVVENRHGNLGITSLKGDIQVAASGVPLRLNVGLKNYSQEVVRNIRLSLLVDGERLPLSLVFEQIEANEEVNRDFDILLEKPGWHQIEVALPEDSLVEDNRRYLAVNLEEANPVLIVDGNPSGSEGEFIADALAADPQLTGFAPIVSDTEFLRKQSLDRFQTIYLVNVPELSADAIEAVEEFVKNGGGLAWYPGSLTKPAFYNDKLYQKGKGLFPVKLAVASKLLSNPNVTSTKPDLSFSNHPVTEIFQGQDNPFIEGVRIRRYFPVADDWNKDDQSRNDGTRTIGKLKNNNPFLLEHHFGKGRILTVLTSAGPSWHQWTSNPSYVVFQLEMQKYLARNDLSVVKHLVGEPIELKLDASEYESSVQITSPSATGEFVTRLTATPQKKSKKSPQNNEPENGKVYLEAEYRDTEIPGIYQIQLSDFNKITIDDWLAYNLSNAESDLELISSQKLREDFGKNSSIHIQEPGQYQWIQGKAAGQEMRWTLIIFLLTVLVLEQLLAYRLSYHSSSSSVRKLAIR